MRAAPRPRRSQRRLYEACLFLLFDSCPPIRNPSYGVGSRTTGPCRQKAQLRFANPVAYDAGGIDANSVVIADSKGDGIPDVVVASKWQDANSAAGEVSVFLGNGDGTFQPTVTYGTGAYWTYSVAVGDVNGDGIPDLVVLNLCQTVNQYDSCNSPVAVSVLRGNGDGTFQWAVVYGTGLGNAYSLVMADLRAVESEMWLWPALYCYTQA